MGEWEEPGCLQLVSLPFPRPVNYSSRRPGRTSIMQEAAAWAGPRFQLTHSAAKGSGERAVLCSGSGVLPEASKTQLPSVARSVSGPADRMGSLFSAASMWKTQHEARVLGSWACRAGGQRRRKGKRHLGAGSRFWDVRAFRLCLGTLLSLTLVCIHLSPCRPASWGGGDPLPRAQMLR